MRLHAYPDNLCFHHSREINQSITHPYPTYSALPPLFTALSPLRSNTATRLLPQTPHTNLSSTFGFSTCDFLPLSLTPLTRNLDVLDNAGGNVGVERVEHASDAALLGRVFACTLAVGEGGAGTRHG